MGFVYAGEFLLPLDGVLDPGQLGMEVDRAANPLGSSDTNRAWHRPRMGIGLEYPTHMVWREERRTLGRATEQSPGRCIPCPDRKLDCFHHRGLSGLRARLTGRFWPRAEVRLVRAIISASNPKQLDTSPVGPPEKANVCFLDCYRSCHHGAAEIWP